jgi:hypothetical protein
MTEMVSTEWWLALPEALLAMNRQVHSTTGKSPYEIVFKQLMPDRPRISTSQRSTAAVIEQQHDVQGLVIAQPNTFSESSIAQSNTLSESSISIHNSLIQAKPIRRRLGNQLFSLKLFNRSTKR